MHTCPDDGALRVELDADPRVLDACPQCAGRRAALRADRDVVTAAWAALDDASGHAARDEVDVESGLTRLRSRRRDLAPSRPGVLRLVASVTLVLLVAALVGTSDGRRAVASVLSSFRAERVQAVTVDPDELGDVDALEAIADVEDPDTEPVAVADVAEAATVAGFTAAEPAQAPAGNAMVMAVAPTTVVATLSSERAPSMPADLDGAVLRVAVPGAVLQQWAGEGGVPELAVVEAGAPQVTLEGGDLADLRAWVLDDPDLPDDAAAQLEALGDWQTTLPIPVAPGAERPVTVGGVDAVGVDYGLLRGVVWLDGDRVRGVAGQASLEDLAALGADLAR